MKQNIKKNLALYLSLLAFLLGILFGRFTPGVFGSIGFIGTWYVKILKILVYPLLAVEIVPGVYRAAGQFTRRLLRTLALFLVLFAVSFLLTALLVSLLEPGCGLNLFGEDYAGNVAVFRPGALFKGVLLCILISFAVGLIVGKLRWEKFISLFETLRRWVNVFLACFLWVTPAAVFVLMGSAVANYGGILLGAGVRYILTAWLGCVLVTVLVMILPVWLLCGIRPGEYVRKAAKIWLVSLSSCSSAATLPTTVRVCNEDFGVPAEITGIVVPLGCTIHMSGGAVSFCLLALFTCQMSGIAVPFGSFLLMLALATAMNMAAPGIPGGGIVLGATYLGTLGLPTGFIGLYSGIYRLLDMAYTTVNVTGDVTANLLLKKWEDAGK